MSTTVAKLAGFATALAVLFGIGALAGGVIDPSAPGGEAAASDMGHGSAGSMAMAVRGLAVAGDGARLVLRRQSCAADRPSSCASGSSTITAMRCATSRWSTRSACT